MNAPANFTTASATLLDPITMLMGPMPDGELTLRRRIHAAREVAAHRAMSAQSGKALTLLWMIVDCANEYIYAGAPIEMLDEVARLCRRLLITATHAEWIEGDNGLG